ncbi:lipoyl synthase, partial [Francisella tularensis subsp. holarctica]|nr:lipoyl synthase [Francisella tularensis subsp. holarctica]
WQTLNFLKYVKQKSPNVITKSSIMVGLGETDEEIYKNMDDARSVGVDIITLWQYMQPTKHHLSVESFVTPQQFEEYRKV